MRNITPTIVFLHIFGTIIILSVLRQPLAGCLTQFEILLATSLVSLGYWNFLNSSSTIKKKEMVEMMQEEIQESQDEIEKQTRSSSLGMLDESESRHTIATNIPVEVGPHCLSTKPTRLVKTQHSVTFSDPTHTQHWIKASHPYWADVASPCSRTAEVVSASSPSYYGDVSFQVENNCETEHDAKNTTEAELLRTSRISMSSCSIEHEHNLKYTYVSGVVEMRREGTVFDVVRMWRVCMLQLSVVTGELVIHRSAKHPTIVLQIAQFTGATIHPRHSQIFKLMFQTYSQFQFRAATNRAASLWVEAVGYAKETSWQLKNASHGCVDGISLISGAHMRLSEL